jgi:hypothetical protein
MINSNFGFTPLKEVWLGDCYPAGWYDHLPNEIADPFRQITEWTKQDTGKLQKFLEDKGVVVKRPVFDSIDSYLDNNDNLVKPPICPRDHYLVLDKTLYSLHNKLEKDPWQHIMDEYKNLGYDVQPSTQQQPINYINPPSLVRMGQDLYLDIHTHSDVWRDSCEWMVNTARNYRVNISETYGHSDAVFCPVAPGVLVSSHYKTNYDQSFPGWEVFQIPKNLNNATFDMQQWNTSSDTINNNKSFANHVLTLASDWVGDFRETVFEVNMLVLDEKNVVAMKEYPPLIKWLQDKGITVHHFDLRTRSFWDGGWHCLTLDIHREDTQFDLFPERGKNGVYWRQQ